VFFAEGGYQPFPTELTRTSRRLFGPSWLVSFCNGNEQQVAIAVSVEATDLTIGEDGIVVGARVGDFQSAAVPVGTNFPLEPEVGAVGVAGGVGARVSALPRYRRLANRTDAFSGIWTYSLDATVQLRGIKSGREMDTSEVGFARWESMYNLRPVVANPDSAQVRLSDTLHILVNGETPTVVEIFRRADVPASLEAFDRRRTP
jgi:hypothetical protein